MKITSKLSSINANLLRISDQLSGVVFGSSVLAPQARQSPASWNYR
ncbi:MAG TPA: hypothetical protein VFD66_12135 [Verrucomicrobiae bacterium]|nr:hypothetical protein [Verrucomicrobiae bacterium]